MHVLVTWGAPSPLGNDRLTVQMDRLELERFTALVELAEQDNMDIDWPEHSDKTALR